ncbi:hypothetical protein G9U51_07545 [Calidifontibacter sp. DB0510]|uniref:Uncharacterized protein n=1 Tax=Metallococcus carri TaxID=1656884 RepID=A0A967B1A2_9MICO|nr:hypothetical protein [Metallococcus carri]NHN55633.1 hypothetical protein [Metallococcus carri]NOP38183.1 hypothetical protein [Calidifontibacter sp. DB2511S]
MAEAERRRRHRRVVRPATGSRDAPAPRPDAPELGSDASASRPDTPAARGQVEERAASTRGVAAGRGNDAASRDEEDFRSTSDRGDTWWQEQRPPHWE